MGNDRRTIKLKEIPSNQIIDVRHLSLIERYKERAKKDLYSMLFIGVVLLLPIFVEFFPHAIYSTMRHYSVIDFVMLPIICIVLLWLIFKFVIEFPFAMKKIEKFNPNDKDSKCCYGIIEEVWSVHKSHRRSKYYASVSICNTDLFIERISVDMYDFPRLKSGSRCILVSYDNRSTYLIPMFYY